MRTLPYTLRLSLTCSMLLLFTACNPTGSVENITPTIDAILPPITTPTVTVNGSAPQDSDLDFACRETINFFFSYKQGDDLQAFRNLFIPSSQYLADSFRPPIEALILLELMPASQEWQRDFLSTPMPAAILPEGPNEYTYYVKFTGHYGSNGTPTYSNIFPDSMTMHMIADGPYSCKIKSYGKG